MRMRANASHTLRLGEGGSGWLAADVCARVRAGWGVKGAGWAGGRASSPWMELNLAAWAWYTSSPQRGVFLLLSCQRGECSSSLEQLADYLLLLGWFEL